MSEKKWRLEEGMTETMTLTVSERQTAQYIGSGKFWPHLRWLH